MTTLFPPPVATASRLRPRKSASSLKSRTSPPIITTSQSISSLSSKSSTTGSDGSDVDEPAVSIEDEKKRNVALLKGKGGKGNVEMGPDFLWMTMEEPHRSRRMAILKAHPEVRKLMGPTLLTPLLVALVLAIQFSLAYYFRHTHPLTLSFLLVAYAIGGTANQNIFLAIHEITHNLAFKGIKANKMLAITANLSIGVPYAMAFKGYHIEHHKFLGEDGIDTDLPSRLEAVILNNVAGKTFFATFQLLFYALRPGFIRTQQPTKWHALNLAVVLSVDALIVRYWGWYSMFYLLISSFFAGSLHPCAAHFIAEHYLMDGPLALDGTVNALSQETTSYYGKLNWLCYNVGYHNEHHDFPSVPWTRLPALRNLAKEFYEPLPSHASWPYVTWKFITDPQIGMWCRAKRVDKGQRIDASVWTASSEGSAGTGRLAGSGEMSEDCKGMEEAVERGYGSDRD